MLSWLIIACLAVGLVLMFQVDRLGDRVTSRPADHWQPSIMASTWKDSRGEEHTTSVPDRRGWTPEEHARRWREAVSAAKHAREEEIRREEGR